MTLHVVLGVNVAANGNAKVLGVVEVIEIKQNQETENI